MTSQPELEAIARGVIDANRYMVLGTLDPDGRARVSPVYYAPDGYGLLYWISSYETHHSRNVAARPEVSIGATMLREVMRSLPVEDQKMVTSAFIRRMGRAVGSQQDADGSLFSMNTYLTNYANMSPQAKQVLFKNYGPEFAENMETIAKATSKIREGSQVFANPSGTARQGALIGQVAGTLSSAGAAAATGNTGVAMLALLGSAGTAVSANLLSRVFTHPKAVAWLARSTKAPAGDIVAQLNTLRRIGRNNEEPELLELADELQTQISEEEGKSGQ